MVLTELAISVCGASIMNDDSEIVKHKLLFNPTQSV